MLPKQALQFPEIAQLRKGAPKKNVKKDGKEFQVVGPDLGKNFRLSFFPGAEDARDKFLELHPEARHKFGPEYVEPEGVVVSRIRAMLPFSHISQAWSWANEAHNAGRMVAKADDTHFITLRGPKGEYLVENGEPFLEFKHGQTIDYINHTGKHITLPIKPVCRLTIFLPELERLVSVTLKTTSYYDRVQIEAQLQAIQFFADTLNHGNVGGVPIYIYRREQEICWNKPDGSAQRIKKWLVNIEADSEWVKAAMARMANFALTGEVINRALLPLASDPAPIASPYSPEEPEEVAEPEQEECLDGEYTDEQSEPKKTATPLRYNPAALRARIQELADAYAKSGKTANAGQRGLCAASLDQCFSDDTGDRHALNFYLTGKESSKDMTDAEILALLKWLEPTKDAAGKYWPNGMSVREANAAVRQAMTDKGQQELM